jgi:hypothetical protein
MARKTTPNPTTNRGKKTGVAVQPAAVQVASEVPKNGKPVNVIPGTVPVNLEEEIRCRAYELYLQRRATAGSENGNENQDWLIAEREILSRHGSQEHQAA